MFKLPCPYPSLISSKTESPARQAGTGCPPPHGGIHPGAWTAGPAGGPGRRRQRRRFQGDRGQPPTGGAARRVQGFTPTAEGAMRLALRRRRHRRRLGAGPRTLCASRCTRWTRPKPFAKLAREEAKGVEAIAAEFGVSQPYVRQRMKLATLAEPVKAAYRQGGIDTATAEAFASVPPDRQLEVWQEVAGNPQHAQHVRNVIAHAWIDAASATFDVSKLPDTAVSRICSPSACWWSAARSWRRRPRHFGAAPSADRDGWAEVVSAHRLTCRIGYTR